jgi:hypothetical protein
MAKAVPGCFQLKASWIPNLLSAWILIDTILTRYHLEHAVMGDFAIGLLGLAWRGTELTIVVDATTSQTIELFKDEQR